MKKTAALACSAVALCVGPALAVDLQDAHAKVTTVIADRSQFVPLRRLKTPIPFNNFRYPYVDAAENVTFIGNDLYYGGGSGNGVYRSVAATGQLQPVVSQYDLAPDDERPMGAISGLQTDHRSIAFHRGTDHGSGLYAKFGDGPLVTVAGLQTVAPGAGKPFEWFYYSDVSGDLVVFNGTPFTDLPHFWLHGLYLYNHADRSLQRLIDNTQPLAQFGGKTLCLFSYQPRIDRQDIVFSANTKDTVLGKVNWERGIFGWTGVDPRQAAGWSLPKLQMFAQPGMEIPESGGLPLSYAPNPVIRNGVIAVVGGYLSNAAAQEDAPEAADYQAILVRDRQGIWHNPIDTHTLIPNRKDGATFTYFNKWIALEDDQVIFRAIGPDQYQAIYVYNLASDTLYFVTDTTQSADGKQFSRFEISTHPLHGQILAAMIEFKDGSSGEYLAKLPGLPVKLRKKPVHKLLAPVPQENPPQKISGAEVY